MYLPSMHLPYLGYVVFCGVVDHAFHYLCIIHMPDVIAKNQWRTQNNPQSHLHIVLVEFLVAHTYGEHVRHHQLTA